jgi:antitoxin VapB
MGLNIKNEETYRLVQELAQLTGESLTAAVTSAVKERLDQLRDRPKPSRFERMMEIARDTAARIPEPWKSIDHGDLLYDEKGLPKSDR